MAGRGGPNISASLPPGHMMFKGLSEATGVPVDTLRRWRKAGELKPAYTEKHGKLQVAVFNLDSIVQVNKLRQQKGNSSSKTDS